MLRFTFFCLKLKRKKVPYVHKFLEACPVPTTLIDDLAGANLKSSVPFFSTTPRYIVAAEKRLSKLFFHHVLYPAGGARRPYRIVVVRGGRGVRYQADLSQSLSTYENNTSNDTRCVHENMVKRPFFYSAPASRKPPRLLNSTLDSHKMEGEYMRSDFSDKTSGSKPMTEIRIPFYEDNLLAPLCGVIESHFATLLRSTAMTEDAEDNGHQHDATTITAKRGKTMKKELIELLSGGHGGVVVETQEGPEFSSLDGNSLEAMLQNVASYPSSFFYVHAQLPSSAVFMRQNCSAGTSSHKALSPLDMYAKANDIEKAVVAQLAGNLEPAVHFAVGLPLIVRHKTSAEIPGKCKDTVAAAVPFGHIQCLLRVRTKGNLGGNSSVEKVVTTPVGPHEFMSTMHESGDFSMLLDRNSRHKESVRRVSHDTSNGIMEPWKLGVSLDIKVPFYARTMTEKQPTVIRTTDTGGNVALTPTSQTRFCALLCRKDCETYILPQRELLFSFHAPKEVVKMCAEQNEERMRRQTALGYSGPSHLFTEGPRTAKRVLQGEHCNHVAAEEAAAASRSCSNSEDTKSSRHAVYEVRALPGDVVFVPRGWAYSVERIVGTAVMNAVATNTPSHNTRSQKQMGHDGLPYRTLSTVFMRNTSSISPLFPSEMVHKEQEDQELTESAELCGVDVEAFLLCYKPYPLLSAEQAAAYVSANYVHSGIEEFYAKGGNNVYHNVTEALVYSSRWQIPLLVFVHSGPLEAGGETAGTDLSEMYTHSASGKKFINTTFQLGGAALIRDGAAQRRVLEAVLKESRLASVTIVHFLESGSEAHNLFTAAVSEERDVVPRLHIFPSSLRECPRSVLHGISLTPGSICGAIRLALRRPPLTKVNEAKEEFMRQVEEMNAVVSVGNPSPLNVSYSQKGSPKEKNTTAASVDTGTSFSSNDATAAVTTIPSSTGNRNPADFHFIFLNGLEKREIIITSPGMLLSTVWTRVQEALNQECRMTNEAIQKPCDVVTFVLRIHPSTNTAPADGKSNTDEADTTMEVNSIEVAGTIDIHTLPHNSTITVIRGDGVVVGPHRSNATSRSKSPVEKNTLKKQEETEKIVVCCEEDACGISTLPSNSKLLSQQEKKLETEQSDKTPEKMCIHLRCSLPNGSTHIVEGLDPSVATLSTHLRLTIAELIGHNNFIFARAYPPHRFSCEEETETLQTIGIGTSSALRVLITGDAAPAQRTRHANPSNGLFGLISFMRGDGGRPSPEAHNSATASEDALRNTGGAAPGGHFRTMADIRREEEEEEKRLAASASSSMMGQANEHRPKKTNRYYGGTSTEYIGAENDNEKEEEEEEEEEEKQ